MNITLVGMPSVGKSTIGKKLAAKLNYTFIDIDRRIEQKYRMPLPEIIERHGQDKFLEIEEESVLGLGNIDDSVISPGGSIIYSHKAMVFLKKCSLVINLKADYESIKRRTSVQPESQIIGLKEKGLRALYDERVPMYEKYTDINIEILKGTNIESILNIITRRIDEHKLDNKDN